MKNGVVCFKASPKVLVAGMVALAFQAAAIERPNIIWLVSEDNSHLSLGCYAPEDPLVRTPHLDALAKRGIVFENCHAAPVCAVSRFALITGMCPTTCGPAHHHRARGNIPDWLRGSPQYLREAGYYTSNSDKTDYNSPLMDAAHMRQMWDVSGGPKANWKGRPTPETPFYSVFNYGVCHESCLFPKERAFAFPPTDPARVRVKPYQPDTPEIRADLAREYDCVAEMDRQIGEKLKELEADGLAEDTIVFYYGDNGGITARSKRFMQDNGTHVPLIVYFPPKWQHLAPAAPGSRVSAPVHFVDFPATVLALAGVPRPASMQGVPFAGDPDAKPRQFVLCTRDRMDADHDMTRAVTDGRWRYIRNFRPDIPYVEALPYTFNARGYQSWAQLAAEGKLTPRTAQFWGRKPPEELYDCVPDPHNVVNLAADAAHAQRLQVMRKWMCEQMVANRDNGLLPEGCDLEGYNASRRPGAWDAARTLDTAIMASDSDPKHVDKLMQAATDESMPVRWWAVIGLGILGPQAQGAQPLLDRLAAGDGSPYVRVAAAYALAQHGLPGKALPGLTKEALADDSPWAALAALTALCRMGEAAYPVLSELKARVPQLAQANPKPAVSEYLIQLSRRIIDVAAGRKQALVYPKAAEEVKVK